MRDLLLPVGLVLALILPPAAAQADVVLPPAIAGNPRLKDLRRAMLAGTELSDLQLQSLADAGDGLAAARYAKRLEERKDPAFLGDAAHYYSIAVYMDRDFALPRLIALLGRPDVAFGPARLQNLRDVLDRAARRGDPVAAAGLGDLLLREAPFPQDIPRAHALLLQAAEVGDAQAAIRLAMNQIKGMPGLPPDPASARRALELALDSPDPGVQSMARTLLGQLDAPTAGTGVIPISNAGTATAQPQADAVSPRPRARPASLEGAAP